MNKNQIIKTSLIFSIIGVLFSGYLTISKLVLGVCPLRESCPFLLGYPVCLYGLIMFVALLISSITLLCINTEDKIASKVLLYVSIFGILFSGYYVYQEFFVIQCVGGCIYSLGLPTCVYGLLTYIIVALCAWYYNRKM